MDREEKDRVQLEAVLEGRLPASSLHTAAAAAAAADSDPVSSTAEGEPDWFAAYDGKKAEEEALQRLREEVKLKQQREVKLKKLREEYTSSKWRQKRKVCVCVCACMHACVCFNKDSLLL